MDTDPMGFRELRVRFEAMPELEPCAILSDRQAARLHLALAAELDDQLADPDLRWSIAEQLDERLDALVRWTRSRGSRDRR